jgi:uncharacterized protein YlxP (DUF503 family)
VYLPAPDEALWVGVLRLLLRIPGSRSLKDRRKVVWGFRDRVIARHRAAVAEVGHLENHEMAVMAVSVVGNDPKQVRARLDAIREDAASLADGLLLDHQIEIRPFSGG